MGYLLINCVHACVISMVLKFCLPLLLLSFFCFHLLLCHVYVICVSNFNKTIKSSENKKAWKKRIKDLGRKGKKTLKENEKTHARKKCIKEKEKTLVRKAITLARKEKKLERKKHFQEKEKNIY